MSRKYKFVTDIPLHFVTYATVGWIDIFSRERYRTLVVDSLRHCCRQKGLQLHAWVIMTNHVHLIMSTKDGVLPANILRDHKRFTSEAIHKDLLQFNGESRKEWMLPLFEQAGKQNSANRGFQLWQQHNHPVWIGSLKVMQQKLTYLHQNPVRAGFVDVAEQWRYSSARDYTGEPGLIPELIFLEGRGNG